MAFSGRQELHEASEALQIFDLRAERREAPILMRFLWCSAKIKFLERFDALLECSVRAFKVVF